MLQPTLQTDTAPEAYQPHRIANEEAFEKANSKNASKRPHEAGKRRRQSFERRARTRSKWENEAKATEAKTSPALLYRKA